MKVLVVCYSAGAGFVQSEDFLEEQNELEEEALDAALVAVARAVDYSNVRTAGVEVPVTV